MKTYLITGGAGYIGSHAAYKLLDEGFNIVIFDNLETGHIETVEKLKSLYKNKISFFKGDLREKGNLRKLFTQYKFDAILHFAGYAIVKESVIKPFEYWENNVCGSLNLFLEAVQNNVLKVVFSSSCATYGNAEYLPIDEKHPQKPINPYGNSKLAVEKILDDFDRAYNLKSARLRYFNVIGADSKLRCGEWHTNETHIVPNVIKSDIFEICGNSYNTKDGTCIRDYINVEDLIEAHFLALKYLEGGGKTDYFNLGTEKGNSVLEIFEAVEKIKGKKIELKIEAKREGDPPVLIGSNKKAKEILGWTPEKTLEQSISTAFKWEEKLNQIYK